MPARQKYVGPYRARPLTTDWSGPNDKEVWCIVEASVSSGLGMYTMLVPPRTFTGTWARQSANRAAKRLNIEWQESFNKHLIKGGPTLAQMIEIFNKHHTNIGDKEA